MYVPSFSLIQSSVKKANVLLSMLINCVLSDGLCSIYSEKAFVKTYALFDDYDEADKWLKEQYLKSLEEEKNRLANLMKKVDERIEEVKTGKGSYTDTWSIEY